MELRQLRYFASVAEFGSYRRAAGELGLSQPTLTEQIKRLELELGVSLLDRSKRPVDLTLAGERLLSSARRVLADLAAAQDEIAEMVGLLHGRVSLGSMVFVPAFLAAFAENYPNVDVVVREEARSNLLRLLMTGNIDACLLVVQPNAPPLPATLQLNHLFSVEYVFAVPRQHRLASRSRVRLAELRDERFIFDARSVARAPIEELMKTAGFSPHVVFETSDHLLLLELVEKGFGIGLTTEFVVRKAAAVQIVRAEGASVTCDALLAWTDRAEHNLALKGFINFAQAWHWSP